MCDDTGGADEEGKERKRGGDEDSRPAKRGKTYTSLETRKRPVMVEGRPQNQNNSICGSDARHLLTIFPEEIWEIILDNVRESEELENMAATSPFFLRLLESRRVEYLCPKVLPILVTWCRNNEQYVDEYSESDDNEFNSDYNSSDDDEEVDGGDEGDKERVKAASSSCTRKLKLGALRLVCHSWSDAVGKFLLEHPGHFQIGGVSMKELTFKEGGNISDSDEDSWSEHGGDIFDRGNEEQKDHLICFKADDPEQVDDFIEKFEHVPETSRNPLFHRKLVIQDPPRWNVSKEQVRSLWESVTLLLQKYGQQIWFCEIRLRNNIMSFSYYFKVREWLELMPNLKVLHWSYPLTWEDLEDSEGCEFGSRFPIFLKCKLEDKVRENPLPKLEHLQVFKTDDLPYPIFREFIKRNDQMGKVQFHRKFPPPPQYEDFYEYDFANGLHAITELSVILWRKREIQELEASAATCSWPLLQKLSVYWGDYRMDYGYNMWRHIFSLIEKKCGDVLADLTLRLPDAMIPAWKADDENLLRSPASLKLNLPQLRILNLILPKENTSLDFILPTKHSLEKLQLILECDDEWKSRLRVSATQSTANCDQIIQFEGYHGRMLKSNVWVLFPALQSIVLIMSYRDSGGRRVFRYQRKNAIAPQGSPHEQYIFPAASLTLIN